MNVAFAGPAGKNLRPLRGANASWTPDLASAVDSIIGAAAAAPVTNNVSPMSPNGCHPCLRTIH
jgi:hypothetical protein